MKTNLIKKDFMKELKPSRRKKCSVIFYDFLKVLNTPSNTLFYEVEFY